MSLKLALTESSGKEIERISLDDEKKLVEVLRQKPTDVDSFFAIWSQSQYDPNTFEKVSGFRKEKTQEEINSALARARDNILTAYSLLYNASTVISSIEKTFSITGILPSVEHEDESRPDLQIGSAILDKQLQLQSASVVLLTSAVELKKTVAESKSIFHAICEKSKQLELAAQIDRASGHSMIFLKPDPPSQIVEILDRSQSQPNWKLSDISFPTLNRFSQIPAEFPQFLKLHLTTIFLNLYRSMAFEISLSDDNFSDIAGSKSRTFKGPFSELYQMNLSTENGPSSLTPLWLPWLAFIIRDPEILPYAHLKHLFAVQKAKALLKAEVTDKFIKHYSVCDVSDKTVEIVQIRNSIVTVSVVLRDTELSCSFIGNTALPFVINLEDDGSEEQLRKWANEAKWLLFETEIKAAAESLGLPCLIEKEMITIKCPDREVEIKMGRDPRASIKKKDSASCLSWSRIPRLTDSEKLSFALFVKER